jgi:hypothetical protein
MSIETDYPILFDLCMRLIQSISGEKINAGDEWLNDSQVLAIKLFRHLASISLLASGNNLEVLRKNDITFIDNSSVKVLTRAALETFLVFHFLYSASDRSLCKFRHMTWKLGGLLDRQKFHISNAEGKTVQAQELNYIKSLRSEITASPFFLNYQGNHGKKLIEGEWRIGLSWKQLGAQAGFHHKYFDNIYSYLCGYSHSSYASAIQVKEASSIQDQRMLITSMQGICCVIMAHFIFNYVSFFQSANSLLSEDNAFFNIAKKWHFKHEDMKDLYGE